MIIWSFLVWCLELSLVQLLSHLLHIPLSRFLRLQTLQNYGLSLQVIHSTYVCSLSGNILINFISCYYYIACVSSRCTVPPESIYPLACGKTSSLPKVSAANSPQWDEFLNLVLNGRNRTRRQARCGTPRRRNSRS